VIMTVNINQIKTAYASRTSSTDVAYWLLIKLREQTLRAYKAMGMPIRYR